MEPPPQPPIASTPENLPVDEPEDNDVLVILGQGYARRGIYVREHILAHFCGAFRPVRSETREMQMPNECPRAFEMVLNYLHEKQFITAPKYIDQGPMVDFHTLIDIWDIGCRFTMPLIQNAAINVFANRIKQTKALPDKDTVEYLWKMCPSGCTLKRLLVDLVREMWVPDGNRFVIWVDLVGGKSENADDLNWAIDELTRSEHTIRISQKTTTRLLACEWHVHEKNDMCEGSEEFALLPEHMLFGQLDRPRG